jgi:multicomponent Na+:H+ antiporter subunit C
MEALMAVLVGVLFAASVFMLMRPNLFKVIFGLILLTNASNLFIFTAGRLTRAIAPLIPEGEQSIPGPFANPVSEALILTAIVIGFALLAFALALIFIAYRRFHTLDAEVEDEHE